VAAGTLAGARKQDASDAPSRTAQMKMKMQIRCIGRRPLSEAGSVVFRCRDVQNGAIRGTPASCQTAAIVIDKSRFHDEPTHSCRDL
jgi:hypothetical protein